MFFEASYICNPASAETKIKFWKILIFATHGLMTILNKCAFQNDLVNILGDMTS